MPTPTENIELHLSRVSTCWTRVFQAQQGGQETIGLARQELLHRYSRAMYRYALAALGDADAAEEVLQEFAHCLVRGDFRDANPERGRFRDLVKTVLYHLIVNYQRQQRRAAQHHPLAASLDPPDPRQPSPSLVASREFIEMWREELLERTWDALEAYERSADAPLYTALRCRSEQPQLSSPQLAELISAHTHRPTTAESARQILHRARSKFASLLMDEIARSLETRNRDAIEQELVDLELLVYCKPWLDKWNSEPS